MSDLDLLRDRLVTAGVKRAYKVGEVPASPAAPYCVVNLDTGLPQNRRATGHASTSRYRIAVQMFGQSETAWRDMARLADLAFDCQSLTELDGDPFSARELATLPIRDPDAETLLSGVHTYTY